MSRESVWVIHSYHDMIRNIPFPETFLHIVPGMAVRTKEEAIRLALSGANLPGHEMKYEIDDRTNDGGFWIIIRLERESQENPGPLWRFIEEIPIWELDREETQTGSESADPCVEEA